MLAIRWSNQFKVSEKFGYLYPLLKRGFKELKITEKYSQSEKEVIFGDDRLLSDSTDDSKVKPFSALPGPRGWPVIGTMPNYISGVYFFIYLSLSSSN